MNQPGLTWPNPHVQEPPALPPVRSEPLLAWIRSVITTWDGKPMPVGRDTVSEILRRIDSHANNSLTGREPVAGEAYRAGVGSALDSGKA